jgi:hypothetical protein
MIDAVTYGMIPSAKIEKRESAEPENVFSRPNTPSPRPPVLKNDWIDARVDARGGDPRAEPVEREDDCGEDDALPEFRYAPGVREPGNI